MRRAALACLALAALSCRAEAGTLTQIYDPTQLSSDQHIDWNILGGTLAVRTSPAYWPTAGTSFPIASLGTATGTFATVLGTARTGKIVKYHVQYNSDGFTLAAS